FPFFDGSVNNSVLNIPEEYREQIKELFEELLHEETGNKKYSANMVRVLLLKIFILISRFSIQNGKSAINSSYNYTLLKNFQQLIERNYTTLKLPKDYAELLYITPNHLNALCNDMLGVSAGEIIRNRIILEAKRLLINLEMSISEISNQLNFNDNSYFSKFFKKQVGLTPEEFRKKNVKKRIK
ncbi:MAG TPA: AraC family transcriptional regulator, partial [Daejeonella sp.]|nr:AraC family transcriptional regulator [Daejeonella sp.]